MTSHFPTRVMPPEKKPRLEHPAPKMMASSEVRGQGGAAQQSGGDQRASSHSVIPGPSRQSDTDSSSDGSSSLGTSLEALLRRLGHHVRRSPFVVPGNASGDVVSAQRDWRKDAGYSTWKSTRVRLVKAVAAELPAILHPLLRRHAALYDSLSNRVNLFASFFQPSPAEHRLRVYKDDYERVQRAVTELHVRSKETRGFGCVVGLPGLGKTYFLRLLLLSLVDENFLRCLAPAVRSWWSGVSAFAISFNGVTPASKMDLELLHYDPLLPSIVRLLHAEMLSKRGSHSFLAFRRDVLELVKADPSQVSVLQKVADFVVQTRGRDQRVAHGSDTFAGVFLVDELSRLSPVLREDGPDDSLAAPSHRGEVPPAPALSSSSSSSPGRGGRSLAAAPQQPPLPSAKYPADTARGALCELGMVHQLCMCITSLSRTFIEDQTRTPSGSVKIVLGELCFVDSERVSRAACDLLARHDVRLQLTSRSDSKSFVPAADVGKCIGLLAGGHFRAAEKLLDVIAGCRTSQPFCAQVLARLDPSERSLAAQSMDMLRNEPIVVAVGLLGFDVNPRLFVKDGLRWDDVYASGALTRAQVTPAEPPVAKVTTRRMSAASSQDVRLCQFATRLNPSFLLELMTAVSNSPPPSGLAPSGQPAQDDHGLFDALGKVRCAVQCGNAPVAWERLVWYGLVALSRARSLCASRLLPEVLSQQVQPDLRSMTLLDLFPGYVPFVGGAEWLGSADVDATRAFDSVKTFDLFDQLLKLDLATLQAHVWLPNSPTFCAVDAVIFVKCVKPSQTDGPRAGELVAVLLQMKLKKELKLKEDVKDSCVAAQTKFWSASPEKSWSRRTAFVVLSAIQQTRERNDDLATMSETNTAVVVDGPSLSKVFGPGVYTLIETHSVLFGTQMLVGPA